MHLYSTTGYFVTNKIPMSFVIYTYNQSINYEKLILFYLYLKVKN